MRYLTAITLLTLTVVASNTAIAGQALDGAALYTHHCAVCHEHLEQTEKPGRPTSRIRSAIRTIPAMASLNHLSKEEVDAIAKALKQTDR